MYYITFDAWWTWKLLLYISERCMLSVGAWFLSCCGLLSNQYQSQSSGHRPWSVGKGPNTNNTNNNRGGQVDTSRMYVESSFIILGHLHYSSSPPSNTSSSFLLETLTLLQSSSSSPPHHHHHHHPLLIILVVQMSYKCQQLPSRHSKCRHFGGGRPCRGNKNLKQHGRSRAF